jgi:hypothetical protein
MGTGFNFWLGNRLSQLLLLPFMPLAIITKFGAW